MHKNSLKTVAALPRNPSMQRSYSAVPVLEFAGRATKRTRFGDTRGEKLNRAMSAARLCAGAGLRYHVIDAEWRMDYLTAPEIRSLAQTAPDLTTVLSYAAKHLNSLTILRQAIQAAHEGASIAVNIVAGNRAYLDWREIRRPTARAVTDAVRFVRRLAPTLPMFIATEAILGLAATLSAEFDLIPFFLLDRELTREMARMREQAHPKAIAVYVPFLISANYPRLLRDVIFRLAGYIFRRPWVQARLHAQGYDAGPQTIRAIAQEKKPLPPELLDSGFGALLREAASTLAIYGEPTHVREQLKALRQAGADIIIGLPIKESEEQTLAFSQCLRA